MTRPLPPISEPTPIAERCRQTDAVVTVLRRLGVPCSARVSGEMVVSAEGVDRLREILTEVGAWTHGD